MTDTEPSAPPPGGPANRFPMVVGAVLLVAFVAVVAGILATSGSDAPEPLPEGTTPRQLFADFKCEGCNVLLLTIDTIRADHLPCQGYPKKTTPQLCAFGDRNLLFERAYSPAPVTAPAMKAILSGSQIANEYILDLLAHYENQAYLPEKLSGRGYRTAGFTDHKGFGDLANLRPKSASLLKGFGTFENFGEGRNGLGGPAVTKAVLEWLRANGHEQFFVWAHFFDPHYNWRPPAELERRFGFNSTNCGRIENGMDIEDVRALSADLTRAETDCLIGLHDAELLHTDDLIGQILDRLEQLGLDDDTLVVITGDHGEEFMERSRIGHEWTVYNELLHVPLLIRNPRRLLRGRVASPISTIDVHQIVYGAVTGEPIRLADPIVSRAYHYYGNNRTDPRNFKTRPNEFALITERFKVIVTPGLDRTELYDLYVDPDEQHDLYGRELRSSELARAIGDWIESNTVETGDASSGGVEAYRELIERLRKLGYTN